MFSAHSLSRRSRTLVVLFDSVGLIGYDFMSHRLAPLSPMSLSILTVLDHWSTIGDLVRAFPPGSDQVVTLALARLMDLGFVVTTGTPAGARDVEYETRWVWGATAGMYHFGIRWTEYLNPAQTAEVLQLKMQASPPVPLFQTNDLLDDVIVLDAPRSDGVFSSMARRRSFRGFGAQQAISRSDLKDCLYSGLGIVGFASTDTGLLPLKMTPSGGARNPFEAYVCVYHVDGLNPGLYHYSAVDNTLGRVPSPPVPTADCIVDQQPWFRNAAALVILVAHFERTMWKYGHPTGFRVVLLEAGHIAQNMLLAAAANDLAATPSCAINDTAADALCGLNPVLQSAIYTVAIGRRGPQPTIADVQLAIPTDAVHTENAASGCVNP
jgi:SagB-type dehydrogenase family enzyme